MISRSRRVVITGMGVISPLGNTLESLWDALANGRSGIGPVTAVPPGTLPIAIAAEAQQFQGEIDDFGPLDKEQKKAIRKGLKVMCRECQMGVAAAQLALSHSGLAAGTFDPMRTGIAFGSDYMLSLPEEFAEGIRECLDEQGQFHFSSWATKGMPKMSPLWLLKYLPNMPASHIAIYNDLRGPNNSLTLREASANLALGHARHTILQGRADIMLVGATGTRLNPMKIVHAVQQEEVATGKVDPNEVSRPFDLHRSGMVLGEGAGAVLLEELGSAQARGATIYAEVLAGASSSAADRRLVAQRGQAMKNVLVALLRESGASPDHIGALHAHGLSTRSSDLEEAQAIHSVFGGRHQSLPVTASKSYFGNLGAGGGIVELVAGVLALRSGRLFPVLNYRTPDPDCPIAVVRDSEVAAGESFIHLSVTPQGQAASVLVQRYAD
jgi:3-oxoacyl-[acyl-carrier-protein] synthase II